jgi:hypothetical protein
MDMRTIGLGTIAALVLSSGVAAAAIGRYHFTSVARENVRVLDTACLLGETAQSASPLAMGDGVVLVFYVCHEPDPNGVIAHVRVKEYTLRTSGPIAPSGLRVLPNEAQPLLPPSVYSCAHIVGFVQNYQGNGCVPAGHPHAAQQ